jgi:hypothetical protein
MVDLHHDNFADKRKLCSIQIDARYGAKPFDLGGERVSCKNDLVLGRAVDVHPGKTRANSRRASCPRSSAGSTNERLQAAVNGQDNLQHRVLGNRRRSLKSLAPTDGPQYRHIGFSLPDVQQAEIQPGWQFTPKRLIYRLSFDRST